ncbi:hypothetical protein [Thiohalorhabdus denitrificans]|uniref:Uncharacterized protein n=1 Tax=Thiohalorhabdus denitrificans TaxID=381306 RepID=A0A1G5HIB7_9GAMM|nr:hypothetical protein [Thiohalorhabdus denitrificans]SCY63477.1 hypothetical protein SAMN05661077_2764 [Thiohalorhabdus denitrificans]
MDTPAGLPRVPEVLLPKVEELGEGRDGWLGGGLGVRQEASQAVGPPVLMGEMELTEQEARELNLLFHRYKGRPVCKDPGDARPGLLVSPRTLRWNGADRAYVEFNILGIL